MLDQLLETAVLDESAYQAAAARYRRYPTPENEREKDEAAQRAEASLASYYESRAGTQ
jgi:hypothetical protein